MNIEIQNFNAMDEKTKRNKEFTNKNKINSYPENDEVEYNNPSENETSYQSQEIYQRHPNRVKEKKRINEKNFRRTI